MLKKELRAKYKKLRSLISPDRLLQSSLAIANRSLELPVWQYDYFHIFLQIPEKKEIDTSYLLSILQGRDKNIVIPKVSGDHSLAHYLLTDNLEFQKSKWNIPEPKDGIEVPENKIEVVFLPLLAFCEAGYRVGYGKGFYDNFLRKCSPQTVKIGLSLFDAESEITDKEAHDIPMDYCLTPDKTYKF